MFETQDAARGIISQGFDADHGRALLALLAPTVALEPSRGQSTSHLGGAPRMASGMDWPLPSNVRPDAFADYGAEFVDHAKANQPLPFIGQIELSDLPLDGEGLPSSGRLLFFYDAYLGPFMNGPSYARVLFDETPLPETKRFNILPELIAADQAYMTQLAVSFAKHGLEPSENDRSPFLAPERAMALSACWMLPGLSTTELGLDNVLAPAIQADETLSDQLLDLTEAEPGEDRPFHFMLGYPVPEQDDPRYDAVVVARTGQQFLDHEEWKRVFPGIAKDAADWRLLLQIDIADWNQAHGEGTVYFLIRRDDLAARRFDKVSAVYQQT